MKIRSLINWKLFGLLLAAGMFGTWGYFYAFGIPYPFCSYRTNVIKSIDIFPPEDDLSQYFEENGWVVKYDDFEKQSKSLTHKDHILEAKTNMVAFLSRPHVTVYFAVMKPRAGVDFEGQIQIYIEQGNRIANKQIHDDLIENLNHKFGLDINNDGYNYMGFCN